MSNDEVVLAVEKRDVSGKKVRSLRKQGLVPAVIYERGEDSVMVMAPYIPMVKVWQKAGKHHIVNLEIAGKKQKVIIKDISLDPAKGTLSHVSFHAMKMDELIITDIPVKVTGDIPAEKLGYFLVHPLDHVEVKALPSNLPDVLEVSGEQLENPGDNLLVSNLVAPRDVEILTEPDRPLAVVEEPRAKVEEEAEEAEAEEGAAEGEETTTDSEQNPTVTEESKE